MAVTTQVSDQIANSQAVPEVKNKVSDLTGKARFARFDFTQVGAGAANSTVDLVKLPSGRLRVLVNLSHIDISALGAGRTVDIGHTGWTKMDGSTQSAVVDAFVDGLDVEDATVTRPGDAAWLLSGLEIESKAGVIIQAKCLGDTLPDAATMAGWIAYVKD